jgi:hypothetical protein
MSSRWIRLDTTWSQSEWLAELSPECRLVWVELLCYCKAHGTDGNVKASHVALQRVTGVTRNAVDELVTRAISHGALTAEGGFWHITGWKTYQGDPGASRRMRRYRQRQQEDTSNVTERDVTGVTRNERSVTPTETETETSNTHTVDPWPTRPKKDGGSYIYPPPFERAWSLYPRRDGSNPKTGAYKAFRARVKSGDEPEALTTAVEHYAQHCRARQIEGTSYVQQAATFWGPSEPWREFLESVPSPNGQRSNAPPNIQGWKPWDDDDE